MSSSQTTSCSVALSKSAWSRGETFGGAPGGGLPRAVGHECDVRLSVLRQFSSEVPLGATLPEEPSGIVTLANGILPNYSGFDYFTRPIRLENAPVANMIYWQGPEGGPPTAARWAPAGGCRPIRSFRP